MKRAVPGGVEGGLDLGCHVKASLVSGVLNQLLPLCPVFWGWLLSLTAFSPATGQDEKNQMMTTNVWLKQVSVPPQGEAGAGWELMNPRPSQGTFTSSMILNSPFA